MINRQVENDALISSLINKARGEQTTDTRLAYKVSVDTSVGTMQVKFSSSDPDESIFDALLSVGIRRSIVDYPGTNRVLLTKVSNTWIAVDLI